jgi:molybdopterin converting factor small subunit
MDITIQMFGPEAQATGTRQVTLSLDGSPTAASVRAALAEQFPQAAAQIHACRLAINTEFADDNDPIQTGDEIALIGQVSGG